MRRTSLALISLLGALVLPACSQATDSESETPAPQAQAESEQEEVAPDPLQVELLGRGEAIAEGACASCHAIGVTGSSLHPGAPPFRVLGQSISIDSLRTRFAEGFIADHPDMPEWQLEQNDIDGLIAYMKSVQIAAED